jgi:prenyl protein peptidase
MARVQPLTIIFTTPLIFGLGISRILVILTSAHIHHAYEHHLHNPDQWLYTFIVTLVQFIYTSIFGWYASYLFLTTKTVWAPATVHTFCNVMGLPRFWGGIPGVPTWKMGVYYVSLVAGAVAFVKHVGSIKPTGMIL